MKKLGINHFKPKTKELKGLAPSPVLKNLILCKKAGLSILVTGDVASEVKIEFLERLASVAYRKKTLYVLGGNKVLGNGEIKELLKHNPDTIIYEELYGKDIYDILTVSATGHQLLTTIIASNETEALNRIVAHCLNRNRNFPVKAINGYFDLIITIQKDRFNGLHRIFSISIPAIEDENNIKAREVLKYDLESRTWVKRESVMDLKEKVLLRTGENLKSWVGEIRT